jgi:hypothetical protein
MVARFTLCHVLKVPFPCLVSRPVVNVLMVTIQHLSSEIVQETTMCVRVVRDVQLGMLVTAVNTQYLAIQVISHREVSALAQGAALVYILLAKQVSVLVVRLEANVNLWTPFLRPVLKVLIAQVVQWIALFASSVRIRMRIRVSACSVPLGCIALHFNGRKNVPLDHFHRVIWATACPVPQGRIQMRARSTVIRASRVHFVKDYATFRSPPPESAQLVLTLFQGRVNALVAPMARIQHRIQVLVNNVFPDLCARTRHIRFSVFQVHFPRDQALTAFNVHLEHSVICSEHSNAFLVRLDHFVLRMGQFLHCFVLLENMQQELEVCSVWIVLLERTLIVTQRTACHARLVSAATEVLLIQRNVYQDFTHFKMYLRAHCAQAGLGLVFKQVLATAALQAIVVQQEVPLEYLVFRELLAKENHHFAPPVLLAHTHISVGPNCVLHALQEIIAPWIVLFPYLASLENLLSIEQLHAIFVTKVLFLLHSSDRFVQFVLWALSVHLDHRGHRYVLQAPMLNLALINACHVGMDRIRARAPQLVSFALPVCTVQGLLVHSVVQKVFIPRRIALRAFSVQWDRSVHPNRQRRDLALQDNNVQELMLPRSFVHWDTTRMQGMKIAQFALWAVSALHPFCCHWSVRMAHSHSKGRQNVRHVPRAFSVIQQVAT